jgi:hypothetical protein
MAGIGSMVEEEELVEYILVFLGSKCDPIVLAVIARHTAISISGLYSQLPAFETRRVLMNNEGGTSVNSASWVGHDGGRDPSTRGGQAGFSVMASTTAVATSDSSWYTDLIRLWLLVTAVAALHARCARSRDTPQTGAGIGS